MFGKWSYLFIYRHILHYITLHYMTLHILHYIYIHIHIHIHIHIYIYITFTLHYITFNYITLHYIILHYITLHNVFGLNFRRFWCGLKGTQNPNWPKIFPKPTSLPWGLGVRPWRWHQPPPGERWTAGWSVVRPWAIPSHESWARDGSTLKKNMIGFCEPW